MDMIDCIASSKGGIDFEEMTNKGLADGGTHAKAMCAQDFATRKKEIKLIRERETEIKEWLTSNIP